MDFLKEVEKSLDLPISEKKQVMKELESHYSELREEFLASGMSESRADEETARRLGDPVDVAQKMQSVHCRLGWRTAFIMALPVIGTEFIRLCGFFLRHLLTAKSGSVASSPVAAMPGQLLHALRFTVLGEGAVALVISGVLLYTSIRNWQAGRRPVWLATWMAGGMGAFWIALSSAIRFSYPLHPPTPTGHSEPTTLLTLLACLAWTALAMWLLKDQPRWRSLAIGIAAYGITISLVGQSLGPESANYTLWVYAATLFGQAMVVAPGIGGFGRRPYGNAAQASLFIWIAGGTHVLLGSFGRPTGLATIWHVVSSIAIIVAVLCYARQTSWARKILVIASTMVILSLANSIVQYIALGARHWADVVVQGATLLASSLLFAIVAPALYGMRQSRQRPETMLGA